MQMQNRTVKQIESDIISMHFGKSFWIDNDIDKIIKIFIKSLKKTLEEAKNNKETIIEDNVKRKFFKLILFNVSKI